MRLPFNFMPSLWAALILRALQREQARLTYPKSVQTDSSPSSSHLPLTAVSSSTPSSHVLKPQEEEELKARMWKEYEAERTKKERELEEEIAGMEKAMEEARLKGA